MVETTQDNDVENKTFANQQPEKNETETVEEINWRKFRQEREKERKEKEEESRKRKELEAQNIAMREAMDAILNRPNSSNEKPQSEDDVQLGEWASGEEVKKYVNKKISTDLAKEISNIIEKKERENEQKKILEEQARLPKKLKEEFSDFDEVCNTENLDYLEYHHPEVARSLTRLPDNFDKWSDAYKAIKRYVPNVNSNKDKQRAEKNALKPKSASTQGITESKDQAPKYLTEERKKQNYERMMRQMKGLE